MTEEIYDFIISDYVAQIFGMQIVETTTCLICHQNNRPKVLKMNHLLCHWDKFCPKIKNVDPLVVRK